MVLPLPPFPWLLTLLLCFVNGVLCFEDYNVFGLQKFQWNDHNSFPHCSSHKSRSENGAIILEMKHRDFCSKENINWNEKLRNRLISDEVHVHSLQTRIKNRISGKIQNFLESQMPITSGIKLETLNYLVKVELGNRNMTVIVDTGSDLTWIQSQPCRLCYHQQDPLFDPSISSSYQSILCNSSTCQTLQFSSGNFEVCNPNSPTCNYVVSYGDGSYTRGDLGREHLKLGTTPVNDFIFGCGRDNEGLFGGAAGILGLGRGNISLISQTFAIFGGVFSYCLPSTEAENTGSLIMGGNSSVYRNSSPISFTNMIMDPQLSTFYFLNLMSISIGGKLIENPSFSKSRMLIDCGTVITRLPPSIYTSVKEEFVNKFSGFPKVEGFSLLDTCFNLSGYQEVNIPTIIFQFEGNAEMIVDVTGIFYTVKTDNSQVCLALASLNNEDEIGIIANYQQKNQRVVYDTKESKVGFAGEDCSFI